MSVYKLCEAKGALLVLCYLGANGGGISKYQLVRSVKLGKHAIDHSVRVLAELGLCEARGSGRFPFAQTISLTRRGRSLLNMPIRDLPAFLWTNLPERS